MKKSLLYLALAVFPAAPAAFGGYVELTISSGLNADVIADGIGSAATATSNDIDGVNYCLVSLDYQATSSSSFPTHGLPTTGSISSSVSTTSGLTFQLASYSGNNALRMPTNNVSATLNFSTQDAATNVYILATSGSGDCYADITVNFNDGTSQAFTSVFVHDWYYGTSNIATAGIGRINRNTNALEGTSTDPELYQLPLAISPGNQAKLITGIEVTKSSGTGVLNILAVSIEASTVTCPVPTTLTASGVTTSAADLGWTESGSATQWEIAYGAAGFSLGTGTSAFTTSNPKSISGLTAATAYDFYVRAICGAGDTSSWAGPFGFSTTCGTAPSITSTRDSSRCGPGTVVLKATSSAGTMNWYASATGGASLGTGSSFTTPSLTATTTYYVAASTGTTACEGTREAVTATIYDFPEVDLGTDTTICPGITYTLDAAYPGAIYSWSTGAHTATIHAASAGTYSVAVTDAHGCEAYDTIVLAAGIAPQNNLPATMNLCTGDVLLLNAGNAGSTFDWSTGATTQSIEVNSGGVVSVDITSPDHCMLHSSTQITERPLPVVNLGADTAICSSDAVVLNAHNTGSHYAWNTGATTQTVTTSDSGTYAVTVTTVYGCHSADSMHLAFLAPPHVEGFNFIPLFYEGLGKVSFTMLNPVDVVSCSWDFGDGSPVSTDLTPTHTYASGGDYLVTLTVINGCGTFTISILINVDTITGIVSVAGSGRGMVLYPNPAREEMVIENKTGVPVLQVSVYDAAGRIVYHSDNVSDKQVLRVASFAPGLYTVRLLTKRGWSAGKFEVVK